MFRCPPTTEKHNAFMSIVSLAASFFSQVYFLIRKGNESEASFSYQVLSNPPAQLPCSLGRFNLLSSASSLQTWGGVSESGRKIWIKRDVKGLMWMSLVATPPVKEGFAAAIDSSSLQVTPIAIELHGHT